MFSYIFGQQKQTEEVLTPITSDQLKMEMLASKCSLEEFQRQHDLDNNENNVFVEVSIVQSDIHRDDVLDVILIDKVIINLWPILLVIMLNVC